LSFEVCDRDLAAFSFIFFYDYYYRVSSSFTSFPLTPAWGEV